MKKILLGITFMSLFALSNDANAQRRNPKVQVGEKAPEIALPNPAGDTLRLSEINKKAYVIVDFWASWCGPCRRANPTLVALMKDLEGVKLKAAPKGIQILSVSLDRNEKAWLEGIEKDNLYWDNHISDLKFWNSEAAEDFGVQAIPTVFLLNPEGEILGQYYNIHELKKEVDKIIAANSKRTKTTKRSFK